MEQSKFILQIKDGIAELKLQFKEFEQQSTKLNSYRDSVVCAMTDGKTTSKPEFHMIHPLKCEEELDDANAEANEDDTDDCFTSQIRVHKLPQTKNLMLSRNRTDFIQK